MRRTSRCEPMLAPSSRMTRHHVRPRRTLAMKRGGGVMAGSNKATLRKVQEAWNKNRLDDLDQYFAPDFKANSNDPSGAPGLAGAKTAHAAMNRRMSDRNVQILEVIEEGDKVVLRNLPLPRRKDRRKLGTQRRYAIDDAARRTAAAARGGVFALGSDALASRSEIRGRLHGEELGVTAAELHQLVMRSAFLNPAFVKDVDAVRRADAREAMRDEQHGPPAEKVAHTREEVMLGARVERCGRLVENDERRVSEERAGEGDPLPLADRDISSAHEVR